MTAYEFFRKNKNGIIISDGGMGTMLQANGLPAGQLPEIMVLEHGEIIERGDHDDLMDLKGRYYALNMGTVELD